MFVANSDGRAWLALALTMLPAAGVLAHGFAGDRFFPATILTDDPYVADEMSLPTVTVSPPALDGAQSIDISPSISKPITPDIGVVLTHQWERLQPQDSRRSAASEAPSARSFNISSS